MSHIRRREWDKALMCLDKILKEPEDLKPQMQGEFVPDKQVRTRKNFKKPNTINYIVCTLHIPVPCYPWPNQADSLPKL